ncbi:pyridoxal 5'-phosphate synthase glutaminase subunit PdxT [Microbacterium sp. zg.Y1090]|uniref:pyridoxal 5'-phosphate synthase glutaminase subunit PdxT n=1 Tax=Microbacterium TaxID=33882 RepID=UPI00214B9B1A|nr:MULTISPECIES: pyridoxal 5'-phosphate synthase glutaminase subunit PdxT [unclassified Microbacterium]MCR2811870.1 pyridoxal 5'-phosphate synthase glutaminase subunit PdxT [Microbacterium sp. zg.Y1084]MCR2818691.1 pyridoxal 5'-phosphate synthase glutaminase subunit PdxT [Microbacterium sp. zg.Y1090]MDL5486504.1 pyridoxal 5'-phosphate synthase glutaminase subunit PdxT [Microbacterium sp. zg-Y1211]WIM27013.1 pyridoxal 5'-phosphate synthase glutaminase subunit PdxT [Microbacterium sp. zg-Y1090]
MAARRAGVLALQGDVREHLRVLSRLGADAVPVRTPADVASVDALVIPGGESSVIDKLSRTFGLHGPLRARIAAGLAVYGTCAGLILLADRIIDGAPGQQTFGGIDATVQRNAFGSQAESFEADLDVQALGAPPVHAAFIRAPRVISVGPGVEVLAALGDGGIVAVRQQRLLGTAFHPEVTGDDRFHALLLQLADER